MSTNKQTGKLWCIKERSVFQPQRNDANSTRYDTDEP